MPISNHNNHQFDLKASSNISTIIIHRQYYEDHIVFIHFKNTKHESEAEELTFSAEYRCLSSIEIDPFCVKHWQKIPLCHVNKTEGDVFYNCMILHSKVLLSFQYELKAASKSSLGWSNQTTHFKVKIPSISEPLEDLSATAVDHDTVRLSWKRVQLMQDLQNFKTENIEMVTRVVKTFQNTSSSVDIHLKPTSTSTELHGFTSSRNYTFTAAYHLIVSRLALPWSKTAGPVAAWIPEKVVLSEPATNQSCHTKSNGTNHFFNITWLVPKSQSNVGKILEARLTIRYSGVEIFHRVSQNPGVLGSFIVQIKPSSEVNVEIAICNEAGCSGTTPFQCLYKNLSVKKKSEEIDVWTYGVGILITVVVLAALILILIFHLKKRKSTNESNQRDNFVTTVGPRPEHPYQEACFVVTHDYNEFPIAVEIEDRSTTMNNVTLQEGRIEIASNDLNVE